MRLNRLFRIPEPKAIVKNNPTTQCAREYWFKLSEQMPFILSASITNTDAAYFLSDYFVKVYHDINEFVTDEFGRCKNCKSVYYENKLCAKKEHKELCEKEDKPAFEDRLSIIDLPMPPSRRPKTLEDIEQWRYYLEQIEDLIKAEDEE
jgi:hypothetical protein